MHALHVRPFTDKQIELVTTFADQAVIAIENVRLFDEVQARTRELCRGVGAADRDRRGAAASSSSSPGELEPVFRAMLENAVRICDAKFGMLFAMTARRLRWRRDAQRAARVSRILQGDAARFARTPGEPARPRLADKTGGPQRRLRMPSRIRRQSRQPKLGGARSPSSCRCSRMTN